jgi:hypothetical protein
MSRTVSGRTGRWGRRAAATVDARGCDSTPGSPSNARGGRLASGRVEPGCGPSVSLRSRSDHGSTASGRGAPPGWDAGAIGEGRSRSDGRVRAASGRAPGAGASEIAIGPDPCPLEPGGVVGNPDVAVARVGGRARCVVAQCRSGRPPVDETRERPSLRSVARCPERPGCRRGARAAPRPSTRLAGRGGAGARL